MTKWVSLLPIYIAVAAISVGDWGTFRSSAEGASVECRRHEDRGAEGAEGGRVWGRGVPLASGAPSPGIFFFDF